jgi:predicted nuclease of restriction endonuclease-like RecB superfamily
MDFSGFSCIPLNSKAARKNLMLSTSQVRLKHIRNRLAPQYLDAGNQSWRDIAEQVLGVFRGREGVTRGELEEDLEEATGNHPAKQVYDGLAKICEDRCEFDVVSGHPPEEIREKIFLTAATARVAGTFDRDAVLNQIAGELGMTFHTVEEGMFADLKSEQRLVRFDDINETRLIERYNVALAQAILLRSTGVAVTIRSETPARLRQLFRAIKFHRLVCEADQSAPGVVTLTLDGPMSLFSATQKYGLQLAQFLPTLLQCKDFELRADVRWGAQKKEKQFVLTTPDGLVSHLPDYASYTPPELQMFVELFRKKIKHWEIHEEADVIPLGRGFWAPDFRLTNALTGHTVYLEVLGFWRKSSAQKHLELLRRYTKERFLLAVSDQLHIEDAELEGLPAEIHRFRQMPLPDEIARLADELISRASPTEGEPAIPQQIARRAKAPSRGATPNENPITGRTCGVCGRQISAERLESLPAATRCTSCQAAAEVPDDSSDSGDECPWCAANGISSPLVWKRARDPNIPGEFLGCDRYPKCRYIARD